MKSDRELLELAAKAAGKKIRIYSGMIVEPGTDIVCMDEFGRKWNPLTDDGDALRLAGCLCMSVSTGPCEASANSIGGALRGFFAKEDTIHQDKMQAIRRAIVRAAAEVGEAMP